MTSHSFFSELRNYHSSAAKNKKPKKKKKNLPDTATAKEGDSTETTVLSDLKEAHIVPFLG